MVLLVVSDDKTEIAARIEEGALIALAVEDLRQPSRVGEVCEGRIISQRPHTHSYHVDIGGKTPALLEAPKGMKLNEGQRVMVTVRRDGFAGKGAKVELSSHAARPPLSPVDAMVAACPEEGQMIVQLSPRSARFQKSGRSVEIVRTRNEALEIFDLDEEIHGLLQLRFEVMGAEVVRESLETVTFFDVNGAVSPSSNREINDEAATEICRRIRLLNISGLIVIDFLNLRRDGQEKLHGHIRDLLKEDPLATRPLGFTRGGLYEINRPRIYRSCPEILG